MLKAEIRNGDIFKALINSVRTAMEGDAKIALWATEDGFLAKAMDFNQVSMFDLCLYKEGFSKYKCTSSFRFLVSLKILSQAMAVSEAGDSLTIVAKAKRGDRSEVKEPEFLELTFSNSGFDYTMRMMTIRDDDFEDMPDIEETSYDCKIDMPCGDFHRMMRDLHLIGNVLDFECTKTNGMILRTKGADGRKGYMKLLESVDGANKVKIHCTKKQKLKFALRYLVNFTFPSGICSNGTLKLKDGEPMLLEYDLGDKGYLRYFLAPKLFEGED